MSPTPEFVPTHRGIPTVQQYLGATFFVDHFSDYTYIHLMIKIDGPANVEATLTFERIFSQNNLSVMHYHCDNGLLVIK